jgi:uncharacterized cupin superfamily protein
MKCLLIICEPLHIPELADKLEKKLEVQVLRLDLAWELFLGTTGKTESGEIDIPSGNPRTKWFSLQQWMRQTLGAMVDALNGKNTYATALLPPCTSAALEYVSRTLSLYSASLSVLYANSPDETIETATAFFSGLTDPELLDGWTPPIVNMSDTPTALLQKTCKIQNGDTFTWLGPLLGSDRLFAQFYELSPQANSNRLHSHSDVDEMFVVLEGSGHLLTEHGSYPLRKEDVIFKPAGSGLSTRFEAGEEGLKILDIEAWTRSDQTDVVIYPDHREVFLRGRGINHVTAIENYLSGNEMMKHYNENYERDKNGERIQR